MSAGGGGVAGEQTVSRSTANNFPRIVAINWSCLHLNWLDEIVTPTVIQLLRAEQAPAYLATSPIQSYLYHKYSAR